MGFEPTISAGKRPQTYALDRAATGTSISWNTTYKFTDTENVIYLLNTKFNEKCKWLVLLQFFQYLCYLVLVILFHRNFATLFAKFFN